MARKEDRIARPQKNGDFSIIMERGIHYRPTISSVIICSPDEEAVAITTLYTVSITPVEELLVGYFPFRTESYLKTLSHHLFFYVNVPRVVRSICDATALSSPNAVG